MDAKQNRIPVAFDTDDWPDEFPGPLPESLRKFPGVSEWEAGNRGRWKSFVETLRRMREQLSDAIDETKQS